jgi:hypothetical protein
VPWDQPLVAILDDVYEAPMQPFPPNSEIGSTNGAIVAHSSFHKTPSAAQNGSAIVTSETRSGKMRGSGFFFKPGATFQVSVYLDGDRSAESSLYATTELGEPKGKGTLTLGESVFVDSEAMNYDPFKKPEKINEWRSEFDQIGAELDDHVTLAYAGTSFR